MCETMRVYDVDLSMTGVGVAAPGREPVVADLFARGE